MTQALRNYAAEQCDTFLAEYGPPLDGRDQVIERWMRHLIGVGNVPEDILEAMPEVSCHNEPQDSPQEYDCGCVAITRSTDRDARRGEKPFEMRLAIACGKGSCCELAEVGGR